MITDLTKFRYETFDFGDAVNMSKDTSAALEMAQKEAKQAKDLADKIAAEAPPSPTFSEDDLEAAKKQAFAEGQAKGAADADAAKAKALEAEKVRVEELLIKIEAQLDGAEKSAQNERAKVAESLKAIAFAAANKVVTGLPDASIKQIENFVDGALGVVDSDEGVKLLLNSETAKAFIEKMDARFDHLDIVEDDSILQGDMKILWQNGYSERKLDELWKEIGQVVVGDFDAEQFAPAEPVAVEPAAEIVVELTGVDAAEAAEKVVEQEAKQEIKQEVEQKQELNKE